ncbi:MAG: ABC transporter ATP-binding protein [Actinomycetota bacterium]|nr:ABC transporter ATP-binding protein [Actinomycetota bacterium]
MTELLVVDGVSKAFGGVQALSGCSLTLSEGSIGGLIGPNGSGKTTLFNVITGYVRADSGQVSFKGKQVTGAKPDQIFGLGLGRTFQLTRIFSRLTVLENMLVATQQQESWLRSVARGSASAAEHERAMELLAFVGLTRLAESQAGILSYGQRKLLELAYVLISDPAVILLDEPAGGINPTLIEEIRSRIIELNKSGTTFLIVEHNMEFVMGLCDKVTVMDMGCAIVSGPPAEIRADARVLDAYLGSVEEADDDA